MYQCQEPDVYFLRGWTQPPLVEFRLLSQRKGNLVCRSHTQLLLCWSRQGRQAISGWGVCVSEPLCLPETLQPSLLWPDHLDCFPKYDIPLRCLSVQQHRCVSSVGTGCLWFGCSVGKAATSTSRTMRRCLRKRSTGEDKVLHQNLYLIWICLKNLWKKAKKTQGMHYKLIEWTVLNQFVSYYVVVKISTSCYRMPSGWAPKVQLNFVAPQRKVPETLRYYYL